MQQENKVTIRTHDCKTFSTHLETNGNSWPTDHIEEDEQTQFYINKQEEADDDDNSNDTLSHVYK